MPTAEDGDNIRQVDKVGGREQRHANCAGVLRRTVRKTRTPPAVASLLEVLHHVGIGECCAWENGSFQKPSVRPRTLSGFDRA